MVITPMRTDVIIFSGQSNMQGQSEALTDDSPTAGSYEYKWLSDSFTVLRNPVGENIRYDRTEGEPISVDTSIPNWLAEHALGAACYGNTNLVPKFCENYIAETGTNVVAVHAAKGSTTIAEWLPGTPGYEILREKASSALQKTKATFTIGHVLFVWLQGESDAIASTSKDDYKTMLTTLNEALKKDVCIDLFGVIRVGRFTNDARDEAIISAQDEICAENDGFLMLTTIATEVNAKPLYMNPSVQGHFSAEGLEKLGSVSGRTLGKVIGKRAEK